MNTRTPQPVHPGRALRAPSRNAPAADAETHPRRPRPKPLSGPDARARPPLRRQLDRCGRAERDVRHGALRSGLMSPEVCR